MITYWDDVFTMVQPYDPADAEPDLLSIEERMTEHDEEQEMEVPD